MCSYYVYQEHTVLSIFFVCL
jgi:RNA recognition motif-containing protein